MKSTKMILCITAGMAGSFLIGGITGALIMNHFNRKRNCCLSACDPDGENSEAPEPDVPENDGQEVNDDEK